jgi:hypothetical protein
MTPITCTECQRDVFHAPTCSKVRHVPAVTASQAIAGARIQSALRRIEHAQRELYDACSDVSSVRGLVHEWERLGKLADRVKQEWHKLNGATVGETFEVDS